MKWLAAHIGRRLARHTELQQDFAVERDLAHKMSTVVGEEHRIVRCYVDAVRTRVLALTPRAQEVALAVEHHHRVVAAIEDIDIIVAVDPDPADLLERPAIGQLRPVGIDLISIFAASDDHRHIPSRDRFSLPASMKRKLGARANEEKPIDIRVKRKAPDLAGSLMVVPSEATKRRDWLRAADARTARGPGRR